MGCRKRGVGMRSIWIGLVCSDEARFISGGLVSGTQNCVSFGYAYNLVVGWAGARRKRRVGRPRISARGQRWSLRHQSIPSSAWPTRCERPSAWRCRPTNGWPPSPTPSAASRSLTSSEVWPFAFGRVRQYSFTFYTSFIPFFHFDAFMHEVLLVRLWF